MTILIGLTGWGDHPRLHQNHSNTKDKLITYSSHFPVVEVDSAFYAIQSPSQYENWVTKTPDSFRFVIKAFQSITGHDRKNLTNLEMKQLIQDFKESIKPVVEIGRAHV